MKYNIQHQFLAIALLFLISGMSLRVKAQDYCVSGNCNNNTYMTSIDPNTIDYDNMISVFHSSVVREADGVIKIWGQGTAQNGSGGTNGPSGGNITTPTEITSAGYGSGANQLSGDILKFAAGSNQNSQQFTVLTTNGLFVWGNSGTMIPAVPNAATGSFRKVNIGTFGTSGTKADGLPLGVNPEDVKMMFGTRDGLAIVTCTGQAWMLTSNGNAYGDGATDNATNDIVWHRVSTASNTPLTGVVAVRGTYQAMMALTADGNIYTWGVGTRLGNNSAPESRPFATLMAKPAGITPKMIGMTYSSSTTGGNAAGRSYYLLSTDGRLFSMGQNGQRQLGHGDNTARNAWVQVTASDAGTTTETISNNVMWISPQEHDGNGLYAAISILTDDGKLWSWGSNSNGMLGTGGTSSVDNVDPHYMPGRTTGSHDANLLNLTDQLLALETGGHTTMVIKQCSTKFGYVGHAIRGSMANGTESDTSVSSYSFNTADLMICGAVAGPIVENLKICEGQVADLADAESTFLPPGATGINWWADASATVPVPNPAAVGTGTYYATFDGVSVICPSEMTVSYLEPGEPGYELCVEICTEPVGGEDFSWNFPGTAPSPVTQTFNQPPSNYGFVLDIYSLDNSFNMEINGVDIALQEIEFQSSGTGGINVRFLDGDEYETDTEGDIWEMTGTSENPLIRVIISPTGNISLFGSKTSGGPLFPLELFNGNSLNTITWNSGASNTIIASQNVVGDTNISGSGYGLNSVACPCVKPGAAGSPAGFSTVGILTKGNPTVSNWPEVVPNGYLVLDASQKGMVVSHLTTTQRDALTAVNGMVIYNTDEGCVQVYRGQTPVIENQRTGWNCLKRGCNEE